MVDKKETLEQYRTRLKRLADEWAAARAPYDCYGKLKKARGKNDRLYSLGLWSTSNGFGIVHDMVINHSGQCYIFYIRKSDKQLV